MAEIMNTAFEIRVSNHEFDSTANITGLYKDGEGNDDVCPAGLLCLQGSLVQNSGYPNGVNNENTWTMTAMTALPGDYPVFACNTFNVNEVTDPTTGEVYKVNGNTLGLPIPAGKLGTYTRIDFNKGLIYRFGIGNLSAPLGANTFFTIANGLLVPGDTPPQAGAGVPFFRLLSTGNFTQGAWSAFEYVEVQACKS